MLWNELGYEEVTPENFAKLQEFARTEFDPPHVIEDDALTNKNRSLLIVTRDGQWIGYREIIMTPVVYPAFSRHCKPRDIWELMLKLSGWAFENYREGFVGVPTNTKNFPQHIMRKLGFYRTGNELYKLINK